MTDATNMPAFAQNVYALMGAAHEAERRIVPDDMVRRSFGVKLKAGSLSKETRSVRVVASTAALDSYDESVEQSWKLDRYEQNPVVLYRHNQSSGMFGSLSAEETLPIGYASDVRVENGALEATLNFVTAEANPMAEKVWQQFQQGGIRAVSVGFRPHTVREEKRDDKEVFVLADNELFEISAVPIPANPEAVARSAELNREQLRRLAHPTPTPAATGLDSPENKEPDMDPKELQATIELLEAKVAEETEARQDATDQLEALTDKLADLTEELAIASAEIELQREAAKAAETEAIEREVTALVGVKFTPAEKDAQIKLRTESPELFATLLAARDNLPHTVQVTSGEGTDQNAASPGAGNLDKYSADAKARAKAAAAKSFQG